MLLPQLPRENWCRSSPEYCCQSWSEKNCCRVSPEYCCEKLPRENRHRISPKYCCQSLLEKWLPNLTKNVATRAAQRELLPKLTKILLSKLSTEIAAKSQQNIAAKAAQRKTWDDSWQNQSSQDSRWNQRLLKLLSREILMKPKSRHQKDLMTFEYKIILIWKTQTRQNLSLTKKSWEHSVAW